jgi:hypothetical protein
LDIAFNRKNLALLGGGGSKKRSQEKNHQREKMRQRGKISLIE